MRLLATNVQHAVLPEDHTARKFVPRLQQYCAAHDRSIAPEHILQSDSEC